MFGCEFICTVLFAHRLKIDEKKLLTLNLLFDNTQVLQITIFHLHFKDFKIAITKYCSNGGTNELVQTGL